MWQKEKSFTAETKGSCCSSQPRLTNVLKLAKRSPQNNSLFCAYLATPFDSLPTVRSRPSQTQKLRMKALSSNVLFKAIHRASCLYDKEGALQVADPAFYVVTFSCLLFGICLLIGGRKVYSPWSSKPLL